MTPKHKDKIKRVTVRVDPVTHKAFKKMCAELEITIESRLLAFIAKDLRKNGEVQANG